MDRHAPHFHEQRGQAQRGQAQRGQAQRGGSRRRPGRAGLRPVVPAVVAVVAVVLLAASACTPNPRPATVVVDATRCAPVLLVAARGSSAPLRSKEVRAMWSEFRTSLVGALAGPGAGAPAAGAVEVESLELGDLDGDGRQDPGGYTAVEALGAPAVDLAANPTEGDVAFIGGYNQSRRTGTLELVRLLESRARTCPAQRVVLAGYSMGAHALGLALRRLAPAVAARVDAVRFFGDPSFMLGPWARTPGTEVTAGHGFLGARAEYVPPAFAARTQSWCGAWDGLCTGNLVLSVTQLLPCTDPRLAPELFCQRRHVDYERWAVGPAMGDAAAAVAAALRAGGGR